MTARIASLAALVCLVAAAPAAAKGVDRITICGADGCVDADRDATHRIMPVGEPAPPPPPGEAYFTLRISFAHPAAPMKLRWLPILGVFRNQDGAWMRTEMGTQNDLARLTKGMTPHGAPPAAPPERKGEKGGGDGPSAAVMIGAPAGAALALGAVLLRRRRRT